MLKNIYSYDYINRFYDNCPDDKVIEETRVFDVKTGRYITVGLKYVYDSDYCNTCYADTD